MLVLDANVVLSAVSSADGLEPVLARGPVAPPLMWSEAVSALRQAARRGEVSDRFARETLRLLLQAPIQRRSPRRLHQEAWRIAEKLGWAKTYDAEYVALARLLRCPLVTRDARLRRRVGSLVEVLAPSAVW